MTTVILHHAGDGEIPPVRVPSTVALALSRPDAIVFLAVDGPEAAALRTAFPSRVRVRGAARDTLGETLACRAAMGLTRGDTLYISTEPGHVARAAMIARILYWRRGVRVHPWPSAPGSYRSPRLRVVRDAIRAVWHRVVE